MERDYWLGRKRESFMLARQATSAEAKLIHYELAGLYSVKAVRSTGTASIPDGLYYRELAQGAEHLASEATDPAETAEHVRMAELYLRRAREATWGECLAS